MTTDRHTITVTDTELYARLVALKNSKYENWNSLLDRLAGLAEKQKGQ